MSFKSEGDDEESEEVKLKVTLAGNPTHIFNPGDQLEGQVHVETSKAIVVERLDARLLGVTEVECTTNWKRGTRKSKLFNQVETIVDQSLLLWPIAEKEKEKNVGSSSFSSSSSSYFNEGLNFLVVPQAERGARKIEFSFALPEDLPSSFQTKQSDLQVDVSYRVEATLAYRDAPGEAADSSGVKDHPCSGSPPSQISLSRCALDFIVLRSLDLRDRPQIEEEIRLEKEKVLPTSTHSDLCFLLECVCLKCRCCCCCRCSCCQSRSKKSPSSTQVQDSKGNSVTELCLKSSDETSKTRGHPDRVVCALHLEKSGFVPGEDINVAAEVRNLSGKLIRATYVAMQQIIELHFKANGDDKDASLSHQEVKLKDIFRVSGGVVRPGDTAYYHDIIHVPPLPPSYQPADQLVNIGYLVTMGIIFEREETPTFELSQPIIIGTTPSSETHSPWATLVPSYSRYSHSSGEIEDYTELDCRQGRTSHVYKYYKTFWQTPVT